MKGCIFRPD